MPQDKHTPPQFDQRLSELGKRYNPDPKEARKQSAEAAGTTKAISAALQIVSEMFAGIAVGAVIGYGLGMVLGGKVIFLALGVVLGFIAGIFNVMRVINRTTF